jgi:predicted RNase H-like nuclease (RuvC/YqgF family)
MVTKLQGDCDQLNDFLQEISKENDEHQAQLVKVRQELHERSEALLAKSAEVLTAKEEIAQLQRNQEELASTPQDLEIALEKVLFFIICLFFIVVLFRKLSHHNIINRSRNWNILFRRHL